MATEDAIRLAADYRSFIKAYLEARSLGFSDLARAAGFGRGFPSDVVSGRRRLTALSAREFEKALKLPAQGRKLFRLLVAREERDQFPDLDLGWIDRAIEDLRTRPWTKARRELRRQTAPQLAGIVGDAHVPLVYAACGSPGRGARFAEIQARTRLPDRELERLLGDLERVGLLRYAAGVYEPADLHLFFKASGRDEAVLRQFREACKLAAQQAERAMDSEGELFFTSALCIDESRLPELKAALRTTMLRFVDESIQPEGNRVVRLLAALHG